MRSDIFCILFIMRDYGNKSAVTHILLGLIPYTQENMDLAFHPNRFFNDLEKISNCRRQTLKTAVWRAQQRGLIEREGKLLKLTAKGLKHIQPFVAKKLDKEARLFIIFDIPEELKALRNRLRLLLREWHFEQVQKSVWATDYDYRKLLVEVIKEMQIEKYIQVFEGARLYPKK